MQFKIRKKYPRISLSKNFKSLPNLQTDPKKVETNSIPTNETHCSKQISFEKRPTNFDRPSSPTFDFDQQNSSTFVATCHFADSDGRPPSPRPLKIRLSVSESISTSPEARNCIGVSAGLASGFFGAIPRRRDPRTLMRFDLEPQPLWASGRQRRQRFRRLRHLCRVFEKKEVSDRTATKVRDRYSRFGPNAKTFFPSAKTTRWRRTSWTFPRRIGCGGASQFRLKPDFINRKMFVSYS
jgi:hypothetical protein